MRKGSTFFLIIFVTFAGCARGPSGPGGADITDSRQSRSDAREAEMGRQIHEAIVSSFRIYTEPRLVNYVKEVGESVARSAERKNLSYQFTILYDDRAYAAEAPGGFVYVTTGFLQFLQNEAELAGLLAYEIAGLQIRDPRFSVSRRVLEAATQTAAVIGPIFGQIGALAATGMVLLHALTEPRKDPQEVRVAKNDQRAIHYLFESGHDPQGYLDLMSRMLSLESGWRPYFYDYFYSRPLSIERYQKVLEEFGKLPLEGKSYSVNRERFLEVTKGVREIYRG